MYLCPSNMSLTLLCRFRSHSLHNLFTHFTSYSVFTSVFVTDSQYHECICHRLTVSRVYLSQTHSITSVFVTDSVSRVYLSQTHIITSVFVTDSQYHECICHRLTVSRVYLSQTHSIMSVFVTDSQYHECICHRLTVS